MPNVQAIFGGFRCPAYPAAAVLSRRFCGRNHVRPHNLPETNPLRNTLLIACFVIAVSGCGKAEHSMDTHANLIPELGATRGEFSCKKSSSGGCEFALFVESCQDSRSESNCARQVLEEFSLKVGESRVIEKLPLSVRYCVKPQGSAEKSVCPQLPQQPTPKKAPPQTALRPSSGASVA